MHLEHVLEKCIGFRTVAGGLSEMDACVAWIKDELQPVPVYVRTHKYNGLPSLVITPTRKKHARLWLAAHIDVVPAPDELFTARREGGRLIGRGAIDMKFAVVCYLRLLRELGVRVRDYDIGVMLTPDEEQGGASSVKHLLTEGGFTGDLVFLPDGYGSWTFEEAAKGVLGLKVHTDGMAAHGSKPWLGRSAILELMAFLHEAHGAVNTAFSHPGDAHWHVTMNVGEIAGGVGFNVVAPEASATVDMRYVRERDVQTLERIYKRLCKKYPHTTYTVIYHERPYGIARTNGYAQTFARLAKRLHGKSCGWIRSHGTSDARFFSAAGIPTLLIGPSGGGSHSDHEWVDLEDLERYYDVLKAFVEEVAKKR